MECSKNRGEAAEKEKLPTDVNFPDIAFGRSKRVQ